MRNMDAGRDRGGRRPPPLALDDWDHVAEASIELPSGRLEIHECTGGSIDIIPVTPGSYRVRACFVGLDTLSEDWLDGDDHYYITLCRRLRLQSRCLKTISCRADRDDERLTIVVSDNLIELANATPGGRRYRAKQRGKLSPRGLGDIIIVGPIMASCRALAERAMFAGSAVCRTALSRMRRGRPRADIVHEPFIADRPGIVRAAPVRTRCRRDKPALAASLRRAAAQFERRHAQESGYPSGSMRIASLCRKQALASYPNASSRLRGTPVPVNVHPAEIFAGMALWPESPPRAGARSLSFARA